MAFTGKRMCRYFSTLANSTSRLQFLSISVRMIAVASLLPEVGWASGQGEDWRPVNARETRFSQPPLVKFSEVRNWIESGIVRTPSELLQILPEKYRRYYSLVYNSHSLQIATPRFPRIILYGPDARTLLTFTGNPEFTGFQTVEAMELKSDETGYLFRHIEFDRAGKNIGKVENSPTSCTVCHGKNAAPIWDAYPAWRGAYGSRSANKFDRIAKGTREDVFYSDFLANEGNRGRYALLPQMVPDERLERRRTRDGSWLTFVTNGAVSDPTAFLSEQLGEIMLRIAAKEITSSEQYDRFRYSLAFAAVCSESIPETIKVQTPQGIVFKPNPDYIHPANYSSPSFAASLPLFWNAYRQFIEKEFAFRFKEIRFYNQPSTDLNEHGHQVDEPFQQTLSLNRFEAKGLWVALLGAMGIDPKRWTMSPNSGSFELEEGGPPAFLRLGYLIFSEDPEIKKFFKKGGSGSPNPYYYHSDFSGCQILAGKSAAAFKSVVWNQHVYANLLKAKLPVYSEVNDSPADAPKAIGKCMQCHSGGGRPPIIPFNRPSELALMPDLLDKAIKRVTNNTMPPNSPLDADEKSNLLKFFRTLRQTPMRR